MNPQQRVVSPDQTWYLDRILYILRPYPDIDVSPVCVDPYFQYLWRRPYPKTYAFAIQHPILSLNKSTQSKWSLI